MTIRLAQASDFPETPQGSVGLVAGTALFLGMCM
jgi:hypothetical protein